MELLAAGCGSPGLSGAGTECAAAAGAWRSLPAGAGIVRGELMGPFRSAAMAAISRRFKRPLARDKADTLLLMLACLLVLLPHAAHQPAWISAACGTMLYWRGWITWRGN